MLRKILVLVTSIICITVSSSSANEPNDYIIPGRALLFDGSLSGIRSAYQIFDEGLENDACPACKTNRELIFLRSLTGFAMLCVRDDSNSINSLFELSDEFGIDVLGEFWAPYFDPTTLDFDEVRNEHNTYEVPDDAPGLNEIRNIIDISVIPEIQAILDDLNSINDSPEDLFRTYLDPNEVRIFFHLDSDVFDSGSPDYNSDSKFLKPIEVDYGEVLLLKGLLTGLEAQLKSKAAYDICIDPNEKLLEKFYGNDLEIKEDILLAHPELLNVLPTANDSNDGADILEQARYDFIDAINYYLDAIDYISNEDNPQGTDSQENEFLYLDPDDKDISSAISNRLITLRDSISNDTVGVYPWKSIKHYELQDPCSTTTWALNLNYDVIGSPDEEPGSFVASDNNSAPSPWKVINISNYGNELMLEMEYDALGYWGGAFFSGVLSEDSNNITNGTFSYWGPDNGAIYNFSGSLTDAEIKEKKLDLNPIFGSSARYPDPVNPRDLLPEFNQWNAAQPGTLGHGLGDDATLGGILPDLSQYDWEKMFNLQPSGLFYIDSISPGQITIDGNINDWHLDQLVFSDITGDTEQNSNDVNGVDIQNVFMADDGDTLYGAIELADDIGSGRYYYRLFLGYSPDNTSTLHSLKIEISVSSGSVYGDLYYRDNSTGWTYWQYVSSFVASSGQNAVEFKIPFSDIPDYLPGRFVSVSSEGWVPSSYASDGEKNETHLKIGDTGTISGVVSYNAFKGDPIFIQAYTDPRNPKESMVATTMITEPGPYTLEGVGIGWKGFVRAYTPLFGFENLFELQAFDIQSSVPVFLTNDSLEYVDIALIYPVKLEKHVWEPGEIDSDTREVDWYYFDAIAGGTYTIDFVRGSTEYVGIALYDRDADAKLTQTYYWLTQTQQIIWPCPTSGRYYVKVANGSFQPDGGTYLIRMTSDLIDMPDLSPISVGIPDYAYAGSHITVSCSVSNLGSFASEGTWIDTVYFSDDNELGGDPSLASLEHLISLDPNETYQQIFQVTIPSDANEATWWIIVKTDDDNNVQEASEDNNIYIRPIEVRHISNEDAAAEELIDAVETIDVLDPNVFKNENMSNALTNKINVALELIGQGKYSQALRKLSRDILGKTNGCMEIGEPDNNDWIETCEEQQQVYTFIMEAIRYLEQALQ